MIFLNTVVEDILSEVILEKIFSSYNLKYSPTFWGRKGNTFIKENILSYNKAAKKIPFFVLTDLDNHECPPTLILDWFNQTKINSKMIFRVAEKEVESWIMADRLSFSKYFNIPIAELSASPDSIPDPKLRLIHLVRNHSRKEIREDILSKFNENRQGPGYNDRLADFVRTKWNIERASANSPSLNRVLLRLDDFEL